jgi:hypothetical protein
MVRVLAAHMVETELRLWVLTPAKVFGKMATWMPQTYVAPYKLTARSSDNTECKKFACSARQCGARPAREAILISSLTMTPPFGLASSPLSALSGGSANFLVARWTSLPPTPCTQHSAKAFSARLSVSPRDWRLRAQDILDAIGAIQAYTVGMDESASIGQFVKSS